ncbi:MAG: mechanosensitive ion channel family protein [Deltaproteobacteria bacterium]|nr:mechanosensitive ion channel family protein [Deltaproteobacteria bacterium]
MDFLSKGIGDFLRNPWIIKFIVAFIGLLILRGLVSLTQRSLSRYIADNETRYRVRKLITLFGYFFVILFLAIVFKDRLGGLTVAVGVAGAGVAFALQEVIVSVAGWVAIIFANFYSTGDRVQLGGIQGDVIDIGVLRTTIMEMGDWIGADQYTGRIVRVANSFVFKEPVFNYSVDFPFIWDEIKVPVTHTSDYVLARGILEKVMTEVVQDYATEAKKSWREVAKKYRVEEAMIDPTIWLAFNDNWIELSLRYVVDIRQRRSTRHRLSTRILEELDKVSDRVSIASATMQIIHPDLPVVKRTAPKSLP